MSRYVVRPYGLIHSVHRVFAPGDPISEVMVAIFLYKKKAVSSAEYANALPENHGLTYGQIFNQEVT